MKTILIPLAFTLLAGTAAAERYETERYFAKGAWEVTVTHDTEDGSLWCSAVTENGNDQSFDITAFDDGQLTLFVFDHNWDLRAREIRFLVDIDRSRWTMDGFGEDISVSLTMEDADKAVRFLTQLQKGSRVQVLNAEERRLATFSLSGSFAGITALFECWDRISAPTDPFGDSADPFSSSADPFD